MLLVLLMTVIFCLTVTPSTSYAKSKPSVQEGKNYTFLLKNPQQVKKFLKELDINNNDFKVTVIEEIGLVSLKSKQSDQVLIEKLSPSIKKIDDYVSDKGELPKLEVNLNKPKGIPLNQAIEQQIEELQYFEIGSPYFSPFNWYLNDVTNNYQSQSINKGTDTSIALIDSGIDVNHPLLSNKVDYKKAKNYTSEETGIQDELGHGTSVAGIITSIAPESIIVPYKVMGAIDGESLWVLEAIVDAANDGSDVINLSLGTYKSTQDKDDALLIKAYDLAVKYASKKGALVVSSAGNNGVNLDELLRSGQMHLPGGINEGVTVSSSTNTDTLSSHSNFGSSIDFVAPGGDLDENFDITGLVLTTFPVDRPNNFIDQLIGIPLGYTLSYGTSLSAPQVSATAALIISEYHELKGKKPKTKDVIKYLKNGAVDLGPSGFDNSFGYGKINAYQSLLNLNNKFYKNKAE